MSKASILAAAALASCLCLPTARAADVSANIGYNSQYIFRGIPQKNSSAFGGLDLTAGGFNLGTWAADVGDGLEIDYYGGYSADVGDLSLSIGGTWYTYTGSFDDDYKELNLGAAYKWLSVDVAVGTYDNFGGPKLDYTFYTVAVEHNGLYGRIGAFGQDFDGEYYEAGYGSSLEVQDTYLLDYSFAVIYSTATLLGGDSDTNLVFTLSRSFDL